MAFASTKAFSTPALFRTGYTPGKPEQTGQIFEFGAFSQESALHEQKILDFVLS
jgi:hypothetical protein